jgi:hypothetical protein
MNAPNAMALLDERHGTNAPHADRPWNEHSIPSRQKDQPFRSPYQSAVASLVKWEPRPGTVPDIEREQYA